MAMNVGGSRNGIVADINVTPMADVIIVLLIIFMVTTPYIYSSRVPLPFARSATERPDAEIRVVLEGSGAITVDGVNSSGAASVRESLRERVQLGGETLAVRVEADHAADYAQVAALLDACRQAGVAEVGLATRLRADPGPRAAPPPR
jgi:biopolymer transport protein TolR